MPNKSLLILRVFAYQLLTCQKLPMLKHYQEDFQKDFPKRSITIILKFFYDSGESLVQFVNKLQKLIHTVPIRNSEIRTKIRGTLWF